MGLPRWLSEWCPSSLRYPLCSSGLCTVPSAHCCCSSLSSSSPHLSLSVWGRAGCLIIPSGEDSFLLPTLRSACVCCKIWYLWRPEESWDLKALPSWWRGCRSGSELAEMGSTQVAALVMWMSPAWSVETVPPGLSVEEDDEEGICPNREPVPFWSYVTRRWKGCRKTK